ncbi:MAG: sugar phosphate nucleotidyltransferase, partial [Acidobacteriota bacterium]|nr:sugar phosphate nucleotidyltransferase [Acidobacteriota bacterium]
MDHVVTAILGGGQGTRLWPLTKDRAKPAVPVAGKFRLIDIPISNSLHAGIHRIYVLTQFNSASLHRHLAQTYRFDAFRKGFVNLLAATQSLDNRNWYQGTADAVRQNLARLNYTSPNDILVLSGDQLYLMDLRDLLSRHRERSGDLTVAVQPVPIDQAAELGVLKVDDDGRICEFYEKPQDPELRASLEVPPRTLERLGLNAAPGHCLASMGIYAFRPDALSGLLETTTTTDFGKEVIPSAIHNMKVFAHGYGGYWRDIGTIPSFHEASLELTTPVPPLDLYSPDTPIYTHGRFLAGTKIESCQVDHSVVCEGGLVAGTRVSRSILGIRSVIRAGSTIEESIVMGANRTALRTRSPDRPGVGIGRNCVIRRAIVDFDARIGDDVQLVN